MVGLSGGKDSWALFQILDVLRKRAPIRFSLVAVNVNSGYEKFRHDVVTDACALAAGNAGSSTRRSAPSWTTSSRTARPRVRSCARCDEACCTGSAADVGATKIALGHHMDDFIETALLNTFFQGSLKAMPPSWCPTSKKHIVIRPLVFVPKPKARSYTEESGSAGDRVLLPRLRGSEPEAPADEAAHRRARSGASDIKNSMITALGNVRNRGICSTAALHPVAELACVDRVNCREGMAVRRTGR
jgi:tRNA 2-thiocytidine biosynthesis protein TtcA